MACLHEDQVYTSKLLKYVYKHRAQEIRYHHKGIISGYTYFVNIEYDRFIDFVEIIIHIGCYLPDVH